MDGQLTRINPSHEALSYRGRIDFSDSRRPFFIYPASSVSFRFKGTSIRMKLIHMRQYWDSTIGYSIDGVHYKKHLPVSGEMLCLDLADNLSPVEHDITVYKRMDGCHAFYFLGFEVNGEIVEAKEKERMASRKIIFYGDSVTAGEVSEAADYVGQSDPEHSGQWSNSYYSYAHLTAEKLSADYDLIAQGGVALMDGTGWYDGPHYMGMESIYDKVNYQPDYGPITYRNMNLEEADVVVVAIGQNDNHPLDYMKADPRGKRAEDWKARYASFIRKLRYYYPHAYILCMTTLLEHDASWDEGICDVVKSMGDERIRQFLFKRNGVGTPGHIRQVEAEEMAGELAAYIRNLDGVFEPKGLARRMKETMVSRSLVREGSKVKAEQVMERIRRRKSGTVAFIGGSITQGALATSDNRCYAARVFDAIKRRTPHADLQYVNAGVGGTTSQFGAARVVEDVVAYKPDIVFVEFSVNDTADPFFEETYEGLVRQLLFSESEPLVILIHNLFYDTGRSAADVHQSVGANYNLPAVSIRDAVYPDIEQGRLKPDTLATDYLHPTDEGHRLIAACVEHLFIQWEAHRKPLTSNRFEAAYRIQKETRGDKVKVLPGGFIDDQFSQGQPRDCFKKGWLGLNQGDRIDFEIASAKTIAIQYKKTIQHPAPIAYAIIDHDEDHAVKLDANFDETWGDCLYIETLVNEKQSRSYHVSVRIDSEHIEGNPFHLVAILISE